MNFENNKIIDFKESLFWISNQIINIEMLKKMKNFKNTEMEKFSYVWETSNVLILINSDLSSGSKERKKKKSHRNENQHSSLLIQLWGW